jgi:hypothetical protein
MPESTKSSYSGPQGVPSYYLGRPASWWISALNRAPGANPAGRQVWLGRLGLG